MLASVCEDSYSREERVNVRPSNPGLTHMFQVIYQLWRICNCYLKYYVEILTLSLALESYCDKLAMSARHQERRVAVCQIFYSFAPDNADL